MAFSIENMKSAAKEQDEPSLAFGGQAVIEGVMIRCKGHMVICVRQANDETLVKVEEIRSILERYKVLRLPFLRGIITLFETLYLGIKGLHFSANVSLEEEEELNPKEVILTVAVALLLAIFLFSVLPFLLTTLLNLKGITFSVAEGAIRLAILLLYLASMSLVGEFRRIFQYHGAEHTAINAYEAGVELNVSNAEKFSRFHPRCGTSFIFIITLISILLFSIIPYSDFFMRMAYRVLLIPVVATISYEILRLSDRYKKSRIMRILVAPGMGLQFLTTRKPDEKMVEVALEAVKAVRKLVETS